MANKSKDKGDRYEREAVKDWIAFWPDLLVENAMRMLGAGRKEDVGDLNLLPDCAVQVKAFGKHRLSAGVYEASKGAEVQAGHARQPLNLGMVLVPNARRVGAVRWMACVYEWPIPHEPKLFKASTEAFAWIKEQGPDARVTALVSRKGSPEVVLGSLQTWVDAYRIATGRPAPTN